MYKRNLGQGDAGNTYCIIQKKMVRKSHVLIELVGTLDEAESAIGLAHSLLPDSLEITKKELLWLQNLLFRIGFTLGGERCICKEDIDKLEKMISKYQGKVHPRGFILHVGHPSLSALSLARTIIRRLERTFVKALDEGYLREFEETMLPMLNRISDVLYLIEVDILEALGLKTIYASCTETTIESPCFSHEDPQ